MTMSDQTKRDQLQNLLRKLFQFDAEELDFGIYRVLNQRRDTIDRFIEQELVDVVEDVISELGESQREEARENVEECRRELEAALGDDALNEDGSVREEFSETRVAVRYREAKKALEEVEVAEQTEAQVYNDLYRFFDRYYDDGDFITERRFSSRQPKYCVPYRGEEVLLHWATREQYFIKSGERFTRYEFTLDGVQVEFRLAEAAPARENRSDEDRYFVLADPPIEYKDGDNVIRVRFEYRPVNDREAQELVEAYNEVTGEDLSDFNRFSNEQICRGLEKQLVDASERQEVERVLVRTDDEDSGLFGHLRRYTAGNTKDYFIHKDLGGFLRQELDFFLKNEVLDAPDLLQADQRAEAGTLVRGRAVRRIAERIIEFLGQIEEFQKRIWEKKKFVLNTDYMVTLDQVPRDLWQYVQNNEAQVEEWEDRYQFENWSGELEWPGDLTEEFLEKHPHLMIDTTYFSEEFKNNLLESFDDLDSTIDGVLIQGDNWQALNLIQEKYEGEVDCVYLDPPYNSPSTEILYKNDYKHSSWLSLMDNRFRLARNLMTDQGVLVTAIDEIEQERLGLLLNETFPEMRKTCVTVIHNPGGIQGDNFSYNHEYAYFVYPATGTHIGLKDREDNPDVRPFRDVSKGDHLREDAANCFYPIYVKDGEIVGFGDICDESFHPDSANVERDDGVIEVYPIDAQGEERKWVFARQSVDEVRDQLTAEYNDRRDIWDIIRKKTRFNYKTVWTDKRYNSNTYGSRYLNDMFGEERFSFPKSIYNVKDCVDAVTQDNPSAVILDYFAGSGTTAEAVQRLNQEDGGERKFVLVEMDEFFDTVLRPRVQKTAFSRSWDDGVPQSYDGISQVVKYQRLESYEDALDNVQLAAPDGIQTETLVEQYEEYVPGYMLDFESRESATLLGRDVLSRPSQFHLEIRRKGAQPEAVAVDVAETFHYLTGAHVLWRRVRRHQGREYLFTRCQLPEEASDVPILTVWRDDEDLDLEQEAEWLDDIIRRSDVDRVLVNSESLARHSEPLEVAFRETMEKEPHGS